jgi:hypothetical protein
MIDRLDLHALADGELDKAQAKELRNALKEDRQAQAEYDLILNCKELLKTKAVRHESEDCWRACQKRLAEMDKANRVESYVGRYAWAMCAALFVLILGSRFMVQNVRGDSAKTADLGRIFGLGGGHSQPSVSPQTQDTYSQIFNQTKLKLDHIRFVGRTIDSFEDHSVIHDYLVDPRGRMALFQIPGIVNFEDTAEVPTEPGVYAGVIPAVDSGQASCLVWHKDGNTMVLAGPRSTADLEDVRSDLVTR